RTEHLRFGSITDKNRFERVLYWPDRQRIGERQVAQILSRRDPSALNAGELAKKSVAVQGLGALEVALYGKGSDTLLADTPEAQSGCGSAPASAPGVAGMAGDLAAGGAAGRTSRAFWLNRDEANRCSKAGGDGPMEFLKAFRFGITMPATPNCCPRSA